MLYKKCLCGNIIYYEVPGLFPPECDKCTRELDCFPEEECPDNIKINDPLPETHTPSICILLESGNHTIRLTTKTVIGRNSAGREYLVAFPDVSKEHFEISPSSSGVCAIINDISKFGTYIDGEKLTKNVPRKIIDGTVIKLASKASFILEIKEGV